MSEHVWMLSVDYEGLYDPAFKTEEACVKYWTTEYPMLESGGCKVVKVEVME